MSQLTKLLVLAITSSGVAMAQTKTPQYQMPALNVSGQLEQEEESQLSPKEKIKLAIEKAKQKNAVKMAKRIEQVQLSDKQQEKMEAKASAQIEKEFENAFE